MRYNMPQILNDLGFAQGEPDKIIARRGGSEKDPIEYLIKFKQTGETEWFPRKMLYESSSISLIHRFDDLCTIVQYGSPERRLAEGILNRRPSCREYLVQWVSYKDEPFSISWEPVENLKPLLTMLSKGFRPSVDYSEYKKHSFTSVNYPKCTENELKTIIKSRDMEYERDGFIRPPTKGALDLLFRGQYSNTGPPKVYTIKLIKEFDYYNKGIGYSLHFPRFADIENAGTIRISKCASKYPIAFPIASDVPSTSNAAASTSQATDIVNKRTELGTSAKGGDETQSKLNKIKGRLRQKPTLTVNINKIRKKPEKKIEFSGTRHMHASINPRQGYIRYWKAMEMKSKGMYFNEEEDEDSEEDGEASNVVDPPANEGAFKFYYCPDHLDYLGDWKYEKTSIRIKIKK